MKVALIIPIYNAERFVECALRSYFSQSIAEDIQYLLVNDCSTDGTMAVVERIIEEYPSLDIEVVRHQQNRGLAAARNTALEHLREDTGYVIQFDADDCAEPEMIERLLSAAESSGADIVWCDYFSESEKRAETIRYRTPSDKYGFISGILRDTLPPFMWSKLVRAELYRNHGLRFIEGANCCEDRVMSVKLAYYSDKIVHVQEPLYHYFLRSQSIVHSYSIEKTDTLVNCSEMCAFLEEKGLTDRFEEEIGLYKLSAKRYIINSDIERWRTIYPEANRFIMRQAIPLKFRLKHYLLARNLRLVKKFFSTHK